MVTIMQLTDNLKSYISLQLESMAKTNPMIGFMKIGRASCRERV